MPGGSIAVLIGELAPGPDLQQRRRRPLGHGARIRLGNKEIHKLLEA
tara:strand:+ start:502 stop:642 length:141 start_codon:yes stop_codon:yes gene_type:complete